jgi:hypothetical protein
MESFRPSRRPERAARRTGRLKREAIAEDIPGVGFIPREHQRKPAKTGVRARRRAGRRAAPVPEVGLPHQIAQVITRWQAKRALAVRERGPEGAAARAHASATEEKSGKK